MTAEKYQLLPALPPEQFEALSTPAVYAASSESLAALSQRMLFFKEV